MCNDVLHPENNLRDLFLVLNELMKQPIDPNFKPFTTRYPDEPLDEVGKLCRELYGRGSYDSSTK